MCPTPEHPIPLSLEGLGLVVDHIFALAMDASNHAGLGSEEPPARVTGVQFGLPGHLTPIAGPGGNSPWTRIPHGIALHGAGLASSSGTRNSDDSYALNPVQFPPPCPVGHRPRTQPAGGASPSARQVGAYFWRANTPAVRMLVASIVVYATARRMEELRRIVTAVFPVDERRLALREYANPQRRV